ncbi:MAG: ArsR family transcriptional regulator [Herbiconiux sp.]|uniref:helix-turn-helix domain-containing protein n=1 Tax=Herbiconiux sp. TaxID=1871186 RepID=UPI001227B847|nr:helix-turn-helix domain-containing protein [Herbiconiux sp.]TAJ48002.1 MAG: ArsR family transcriptional regulator [Herbiconiux sp.]
MPHDDASYTGLRLDEKAVRVLAHPLRSRILSRLRLHGPATATELATALVTNTGATSYHLRALEGVGLVTDTGDGVGKRRVWRASTEFHSWVSSDFAHDDDAQTALGWLERDYVRQFAHRAEAWLDAQHHWPAEWVDRLGLSDSVVTVTPEQAEAMAGEVSAVIARYRTAGEGDERARRVFVVVHTSPVDPASVLPE